MSGNGHLPGSTAYIPCMSDHAHALAAIMHNMGMDAEVLPAPDEESMTIGLELCGGRECLPCFLTIGDLIRRSRLPGFDPERAVFVMPGSEGPCRFGQYAYLQRDVLGKYGLGSVEVVSPSTHDVRDSLGTDPAELRKRFWKGALAVDLLTKLLHEHRPYEVEQGAAQAAYQTGLDAVIAAIERHGVGEKLLDAMDVAADAFSAVATDRSVPRPLVAVIGEVYIRMNSHANRHIIEQVEAAGGQVSLAGFAEWQYFSHWTLIDACRILRKRRETLKAHLTHAWMRHAERQLHGRVAHVLSEGREPKAARLANGVRKYYDPSIGGEVVPTLARAIEFGRSGAAGILNVLPFSCMPGILGSAIAPRLRADLNWIPWLDLSFDGQETTNVRTRLEAFMHQVLKYAQRQRQTAREPASRTSKAEAHA